MKLAAAYVDETVSESQIIDSPLAKSCRPDLSDLLVLP